MVGDMVNESPEIVKCKQRFEEDEKIRCGYLEEKGAAIASTLREKLSGYIWEIAIWLK